MYIFCTVCWNDLNELKILFCSWWKPCIQVKIILGFKKRKSIIVNKLVTAWVYFFSFSHNFLVKLVSFGIFYNNRKNRYPIWNIFNKQCRNSFLKNCCKWNFARKILINCRNDINNGPFVIFSYRPGFLCCDDKWNCEKTVNDHIATEVCSWLDWSKVRGSNITTALCNSSRSIFLWNVYQSFLESLQFA